MDLSVSQTEQLAANPATEQDVGITPTDPAALQEELAAQRRVLELLREGIAACKAGNRSLARRLLQEVTEWDPQNEMAWMWLSGVAQSPHEMVAYLNRVLQLNPDNVKAQEGMRLASLEAGSAAAKVGHRALARHHFRAIVRLNPRDEEGWLRLASVADTPAEGLAYVKRVLAINSKNGKAREALRWFERQGAEDE